MIVDLSYILTPFLAWLIAGITKFLINSFKERRLAFNLIGYGGFPSTHSAIVSSMVALIAMQEGISHPAFGVALTLAFIVILDANSLRHQIGLHAEAINKFSKKSQDPPLLRERIGHTRMEIAAGILTGIAVAAIIPIASYSG